eukprot:EC715423.1.p1 GENE.EC715423.1~~EC715423.1.p1  ORF type:complete len:165 (+),score=16.52 EC715423.1:52-495(+)
MAEAKSDAPSAPAGLRLTFATPAEPLFTNAPVELVNVPGGSGVLGILANHVPTVAELQPGVVMVKEKEGVEKKFFVSSGFAIMGKANDLTINALEAVPLDVIDKEAARKGLDEYTAKVASAASDADRARAQVGVDVHRALVAAVASL